MGVAPDAADRPRVLVVEDERAIREPLSAALAADGYETRTLAGGNDIEREIANFAPDIALLDVMLPGRDGFVLARAIRRRDDVPIVFLTGRDEPVARLHGFACGGDDYIVKPFLIAELLARVRAILRRSGRSQSRCMELGALRIDDATATVTVAGAPVALTPTEYRLLLFLARSPGRTLSKLQILAGVWGYEAYDENLVEVHVSSLRRKLDGAGDAFITTVRGRGYTITA